jgi:prepilin-type N-terminal cleavage/methylation domain-containing protein
MLRNEPSTNRSPGCARGARAFTLIELILVMTILTIAVSVTAPALANFFRGRSLDSEARRLLSLTRQGQSRALSEGVPMELWFDAPQSEFGLEAEPTYEPTDAKAVTFALDKDMRVEVTNPNPRNAPPMGNNAQPSGLHANLPRIKFLPDGYIAESSPPIVRLMGRDGITISLVQSTNRLTYELRTGNE